MLEAVLFQLFPEGMGMVPLPVQVVVKVLVGWFQMLLFMGRHGGVAGIPQVMFVSMLLRVLVMQQRIRMFQVIWAYTIYLRV